MSNPIEHLLQLLQNCTTEERRAVFEHLRKEFPIHPLEERLNIEAEIILEAIARDDTGLTFRMMRGVIAEAAFEDWTDDFEECVKWMRSGMRKRIRT